MSIFNGTKKFFLYFGVLRYENGGLLLIFTFLLITREILKVEKWKQVFHEIKENAYNRIVVSYNLIIAEVCGSDLAGFLFREKFGI